MPGQIIVLPGVKTAAASAAERIDMTAADYAAARIPQLAHVVSARSLKSLPSGGVSGRCRATGLALTPRGSSLDLLAVSDAGGKPGLGSSQIAAAGLSLPPGSLTESCTIVATIYLDSSTISSTGLVNLLSGFNSLDAYSAYMLRYYGSNYDPAYRAGQFITQGTGLTSPEVYDGPAALGWSVVVVDFDNETRKKTVAINSIESAVSDYQETPNTVGNGSYLEIGYHSGNNDMLNAKLGDLYVFNESLMKNDAGNSALSSVVDLLVDEYGI